MESKENVKVDKRLVDVLLVSLEVGKEKLRKEVESLSKEEKNARRANKNAVELKTQNAIVESIYEKALTNVHLRLYDELSARAPELFDAYVEEASKSGSVVRNAFLEGLTQGIASTLPHLCTSLGSLNKAVEVVENAFNLFLETCLQAYEITKHLPGSAEFFFKELGRLTNYFFPKSLGDWESNFLFFEAVRPFYFRNLASVSSDEELKEFNFFQPSNHSQTCASFLTKYFSHWLAELSDEEESKCVRDVFDVYFYVLCRILERSEEWKAYASDVLSDDVKRSRGLFQSIPWELVFKTLVNAFVKDAAKNDDAKDASVNRAAYFKTVLQIFASILSRQRRHVFLQLPKTPLESALLSSYEQYVGSLLKKVASFFDDFGDVKKEHKYSLFSFVALCKHFASKGWQLYSEKYFSDSEVNFVASLLRERLNDDQLKRMPLPNKHFFLQSVLSEKENAILYYAKHLLIAKVAKLIADKFSPIKEVGREYWYFRLFAEKVAEVIKKKLRGHVKAEFAYVVLSASKDADLQKQKEHLETLQERVETLLRDLASEVVSEASKEIGSEVEKEVSKAIEQLKKDFGVRSQRIL